ncbi:elongator complex protein 3 [Chloroflexota bacterium]
MRKLSRTISGVTPLAVMTQPAQCPGECVYCPTYSAVPQSYTPESPAVLRAIKCDYDAGMQVELRLRILTEMQHPTGKIELIIMGGTFLACPREYQYSFVKGCYDALNGVKSTSLQQAQRLNETAAHRCVGLCIETRPDWCREEDIKRMLEFGATRVELGVQTLDDQIYKLVRREHGVAEVVKATALLKQYGFKVHYHWMPGLPGSSPQHDLELSKMMFEDERFRPDGLKLYPTMVVAGTELERWYRQGRYLPYDNDVMKILMADIKAVVPQYVRISRVLRDIPAKFIVAGLKDSLREMLKHKLEEQGKSCKCIRCREYGHRLKDGWHTGKPELTRFDYNASEGKEVFLSFEDKNNTLFGLLRLRIQQKPSTRPGQTNGHPVIIRELHVYGPEVALGGREEAAIQHRGLGRLLLQEAERIAVEEFDATNIAILSGVGAREYYRSDPGYSLKAGYMVKQLNISSAAI